jgi:MarR family transcriptional regulator, lower aerobic nicotinate degradation pathway regulator
VASSAGADLRSFTGFLLRRAYVRAVGIEQACIGDDARIREISILIILDELGAVSQREVAELTHISPTVMVRLVDALEARGWVSRERNTEDRRAYALRLTTVGRTALRRLSIDLDTTDQQLTAGLTRDEVERLNRHLRALLEGDPALQVRSLAGRTGYLVTQAHVSTREQAQQQLAGLDLHPRDFGLLAVIGRDEPCTQNHIASTLGVSDPAILPALDALEARGLLTRARNAADRRQSDVRLTETGRAAFSTAGKHAAALQADVVRRLGPKDHDDLRELLLRIIG